MKKGNFTVLGSNMLRLQKDHTTVEDFANYTTYKCHKDYAIQVRNMSKSRVDLSAINTSTGDFWNFSTMYTYIGENTDNYYNFGPVKATGCIMAQNSNKPDVTHEIFIPINVFACGISTSKPYIDISFKDDTYTVVTYKEGWTGGSIFDKGYARFELNTDSQLGFTIDVNSGRNGVTFRGATSASLEFRQLTEKEAVIDFVTGGFKTPSLSSNKGMLAGKTYYMYFFTECNRDYSGVTPTLKDAIDIYQNQFDAIEQRLNFQIGEMANIFVSR